MIMANELMIIMPYWHAGTWVFDDEATGLCMEPFVAGIPEMINDLVGDIPNAQDGFRLTFSASPFPGYQIELIHVRGEYEGNWYKRADDSMEGWLCPALFKYFDRAPQKLYAKADPI